MKKTLLLTTVILFFAPIVSADYKIKFDSGNGNPCPLYVQFQNGNGGVQNCEIGGVMQADASCGQPGETITWQSNKRFKFGTLPPPYTVAFHPNQKKATMVIPLGAPDIEFKYDIWDVNDTCKLDPRIIVNPNYELTTPFIKAK